MDLAKQAEHLPEGEQRADQQNADDEAVEAGIGAESDRDRLVENEDDEADQDQKRHHPDEEYPGRREQADVGFRCHGIGATRGRR